MKPEMQCLSCRVDLSPGVKFCPECGARVVAPTPVPASPPPGSSAGPEGQQRGALIQEETTLKPPPAAGGGRFRIERELGRGGMGVVYLAHDVKLRRPVALKRMRPETAEDAALIRRFQEEALALAALRSPHIVEIVDADTDEAGTFIVMEFLEGDDLAQELRRHGPLPLGEVLALGRQVLDALREAHGEGIYHRDLKPANLRRHRSGVVKLIDWGIARVGRQPRSDLSVLGGGPRTEDYAAPEQADGQEIDGRADLYALAKTLYECLTGQRPRTVRLDAEAIPSALRRILGRALEDDRARRYRSAADMLVEWERAALALEGPTAAGGARGAGPAQATPGVSLAPDQLECPRCHTVNPRSRRFCRACGQPVYGRCGACGKEHDADEQHCGGCGANLAEAARAKAAALLGAADNAVARGEWEQLQTALEALREVDHPPERVVALAEPAINTIRAQIGAEAWAAAERGLTLLEALGVGPERRAELARALAGAREQAKERERAAAEEEERKREAARRAAEETERRRREEEAERQRAATEAERQRKAAAEEKRKAQEAAERARQEAERKRQAEDEARRDTSEMILIPAGEFLMGSDEGGDEKPPRKVHLDAFEIDKHPVTNARWKRFMDAAGYRERQWWSKEGWEWREKDEVTQPGYWTNKDYNAPEQPVVGVSWYEAEAFCRWAGKQLPTEAEWEKAARGTDGRKYPWGNDWDPKRTNSNAEGPGKPTPVGSYPSGASPYGVRDMAGNVREWVADWYDEAYYKKSPKQNPPGPESGHSKVLRGGSWYGVPIALRTANRISHSPAGRDHGFGFRCARRLSQGS